MKKFLLLLLISAFVLVQSLFSSQRTTEEIKRESPDSTRIHKEVWEIVRDNFYDPNFRGINWQAMLGKYSPLVEKARNKEELYQIINLMLSELGTSHTELYSPSDQMYYMLLSIFKDASLEGFPKDIPKGQILYTEIGIFTKRTAKGIFISSILEGSPADKDGLKVGDRIISVEGKPYHPVEPFRGKAEQKVMMEIQRTQDPSSIQELIVTPREINPSEAFLEAQKNSLRVIEKGSKSLGYIHIWSYAGEEYQQCLEECVENWNVTQNIDGLILDLRGGLGGANPEYLDIFNKNVPTITCSSPTGEKIVNDVKWRKPVVLIVNEETRSGKELFAFGFKKYKTGKLVGTKTAGAVVGGRPFFLSDGSFLYLAVEDILVDGERLEGVGVQPDVEVTFPLEYAQGRDPQLEKAIEVLGELIESH